MKRTKKCPHCGEVKSIETDYYMRKSTTGRKIPCGWCKTCHRGAVLERAELQREALRILREEGRL